ncbi:MAG: hypothetical protein GXO21_01455, partial [Aquificae bacterium]|nr:hypothetical protein [Aquificota bacterium]
MVKTEKGYFYKKHCLQCNKEFLGVKKRKFCSIKCSVLYRSKNRKYSLKCKKCGKIFHGYNPRQFYCDICKEELTSRTCITCGKKFFIKLSEKKKYCSKTCERKYLFKEDIFSEIDTFEKAYWYGFLMGDGHIRLDEKRSIRELILGLGKKDYGHLIKFA